MDRFNHVNIKQEEDDQQISNEGDASCQFSDQVAKLVKKEEDGDGIVKQVQPCTKVKKEEDDGECKVEWDGDECHCEECRVEREVKIEFNQSNPTAHEQVNSCLGPSEKGGSEQCKRIKKEDDGNEDDQAGNDSRGLAVDDEDGEDGGDLDEEQSEDGQIRIDEDDETEIDDEEYEMAIDGEESIVDHGQDNSDESMVIQQEESDANNAIGEQIATEYTTDPIEPNLAKPNRHFQCSNCHKSFERKHDLKRHIRVHTGERPFQCNQCDKRFNERENLTRHQLIHQNIKSFRCPECDKQFTQKHSLDSHLRTHSGERPFACRHCVKLFNKSDARNTHEQAIHLHVKPYRCKQCAHTANKQSNVITHIRVVHFGLPPTIKHQRALNIIDERDPRELVEKV